ncbi:MAG: DoxX family protein [Halioglobus sp.]|nr:DoxX family protein [Halioglobus sp.]
MPDYLQARSRAAVQLWPIAVLRVYTGVFFAFHGLGKLRGHNFAEGLAGFVNGSLESSFSFYRPFLESMVLAHSALFAVLVAWGEFALGVALVLGFATRYAAFGGALMVANFWFAKGQGWLAGDNHDVIWLAILLVLALVPAGRIAGLDGRLADRLRFLR